LERKINEVTPMKTKHQVQLPILIERDEDGYYVVECPTFSGCYTQGKTLDKAMKNIREAIQLCLKEKDNQARLRDYHPKELAFSTLTYA
jgi:predicted RNase H-like HicB family nuclease